MRVSDELAKRWTKSNDKGLMDSCLDLLDARAEIERLKRDVAEYTEIIDEISKKLGIERMEQERLRRDVADLQAMVGRLASYVRSGERMNDDDERNVKFLLGPHRPGGAMNPDKVWDVLVQEAGAREEDRAQFLSAWPACREYRFSGRLGFGGKVWSDDPPRISCYREDETPERLGIIERVNRMLAGAEKP